jgi:predicted metal-dependent phosphoesterase TrpH
VGAIDLHLHSNASDGEYAPAEVIRRAAAAGLATIALTDHDTLAGLPEALEAGASVGVRVIAGCEFSVATKWGELHLLGYFLPLDEQHLEDYLADKRRARVRRAEQIVQRLNGLGVEVGVDEVLNEACGDAIGRPHVARALVQRGAVPDVDAAFRKYLGWRRPAFVPKVLPPVEEVAGLVRAVGGVTSAAHLKDRATRGSLKLLKKAGVDGVEVHHPSHGEARANRTLRLANELTMLPTGGTDWHGDAHDAGDRAPLGSADIPEEWLERLERLHQERRSLSEATQ